MTLILVLLSAQFCLAIRLITGKKVERYRVDFFSSDNNINLQLGKNSYELPPGDELSLDLMENDVLRITQEEGGSYKIRKGNNIYSIKIPIIEVKLEHGKN